VTLRADLYWSFRSPYSWLAIGRYRALTEAYDLEIDLKPVYPLAIRQPDFFERNHPNWLGYTLLFSGQEQDAITVFQRNTQDYPESSNVWDSLAEAYMKTGQKDLAIQNYEKALRLDPKNRNATDQLKKLRASN